MNSPLKADRIVVNAASNTAIAAGTASAHAVVDRLVGIGIKVYVVQVIADRRPTLVVDALPEGVKSGIKARFPNGQGGTTEVHAAEYMGCQLECSCDTYTEEQAARITRALSGGKAQLEVVDGRR